MATKNARQKKSGHKKPDLFRGKYPKEKSVKMVTTKQDAFLEHRHKELNAILFPVVLWLGRNVTPGQLFTEEYVTAKIVVTEDLRQVFGLSKKNDKLLISFIKHEAENIYRFDSEGKHKGHMTAYEISEAIKEGCKILRKKMSNVPIHTIRENVTKEVTKSGSPLLYSKAARYLWNGRLNEFWYQDAYAELTRLLPWVEPAVLFHILAGTSINTTLQSNITLFFRALGQYENGGKEFKRLIPAAIDQLNYFVHHGRLKGRKIGNFADALLGVALAVVVDLWMMRVFGVDRKYKSKSLEMKSRSPSKRTYDSIEYYIRLIAPLLDLEPRAVQAMMWGGIRTEETGGGNKSTYTNFIGKYLHWNDMFIAPNKVYAGADGVHFGTEATADYKGLLKSGVFTVD